jgi:O-methyltransferase
VLPRTGVGPTVAALKLRRLVSTPVRRVLGRFGFTLRRNGDPPYPVDYDDVAVALFESVRPYTLTSHERVNALRHAVEYVVGAGIEGAIVECGVWRGGSMLAVAKTLLGLGVTDRDLYLFDTFTTMPPPGEEDVDVLGNHASDLLEDALANPAYDYLPRDQVRQLLLDTGYPAERVHLVPGMVEDTIPEGAPHRIALCRLDTDWYASTKHELEHLVHRITEGGVLIIDDYGHFMGARQAVDEYLEAIGGGVLLNRIDFTGRLAIMTADACQRAEKRAASGQ